MKLRVEIVDNSGEVDEVGSISYELEIEMSELVEGMEKRLEKDFDQEIVVRVVGS